MRRWRRNRCGSTAFAAALVLLCAGPAAARQAAERTGAGALVAEAAGATLGSAAGFGLAVLINNPNECNNEDLACILEKVGVALVFSAAGAAAGDVIAGRLAETRPSTIGASIGSLAGLAAGFGVVHLISEELDLSSNDAVLFVSYSLVHGMVTALGSRIGALIRG